MNPLRMATLCLVLATTNVWGTDSKTALEQARTNYQQSVAQYGKNSPQAKTARTNLRNARHTYHADRHQKQHENPHVQ